jgi:phage-related protein
LARVCCAHVSVVVVSPTDSPTVIDEKGEVVRFIGIDVGQRACEVAIAEDGKIRSAGRIATTREQLELFAQSLGPDDHVALEAGSSTLAITRILEPHVARVVIANTKKPDASAVTDRRWRLRFAGLGAPDSRDAFGAVARSGGVGVTTRPRRAGARSRSSSWGCPTSTAPRSPTRCARCEKGERGGGARHLRQRIWEVLVDQGELTYRVLFASVGERGRILLSLEGFAKKTRKTPPATIDLAETRLKDWEQCAEAD